MTGKAAAEKPGRVRGGLTTAIATFILGIIGGVTTGVVVAHLTAPPLPLPQGVALSPDFRVSDLNACMWTLGTMPIPLTDRDPVKVRVDGRCNAPFNPDPAEDVGVAAYSEASNGSRDDVVRRVENNEEVTLHCFVGDGDVVTDARSEFGPRGAESNQSAIWLNIGGERAREFIPNVNIGGGFTAIQLRDLEVPPC